MIPAYSYLKKKREKNRKITETYRFFNKQIDNYLHKEIMNRNFIFAFILMATLSTVYAIPLQPRDICSTNAGEFNVIVSPDNIVPGSPFTFKLSGKLNGDISTGSIFNAALIDSDLNLLATYSEDYCSSQSISCPISAGVEFSTEITKTAPDTLPKSFTIGVSIISQKNNFIACKFIDGSS
jgi:ML domain